MAHLFFATFSPVFFFYLLLLPPTLTRGGDSGELIAASFTQGIAHPSGYPIWCVLGRVFALLPFGDVAWRYNLFSAFCGALAVGFLALALFELARSPVFRASQSAAWGAAFSGSFLFAGFFYAASQFLITEVYASAAFCGALLIFLALRWHLRGDWRDAYALAFVAGLAPLVHLSTVFYLPWLFVVAIWKKRFSLPKISVLTSLFALGLAPAVYFPIRSAPFPEPPSKNIDAHAYYPLDWTHPSDWPQFKTHITAAQYRSLLVREEKIVVNGREVSRRVLTQNPAKIPEKLAELGAFVALQFLWATPLLFVGIWQSARSRLIFACLLLIFLSNLAVQINYDVPDLANFFFPVYLVLAIWMGLGWLAVFEWAQKRRAIWQKAAILVALATILSQWSIFAATTLAKERFLLRDLAFHQAQIAQNQARKSGTPSFVFFGTDDWLWAFWYAKFAENRAPDVHTPWGRRNLHQMRNGRWGEEVAAYARHGTVFMASWDAPTDARFPYVLADEKNGALWIPSPRELPAPARAFSAISPVAKAQIQSAKLRRGPLWTRPNSSAFHTLQGTLHALDVTVCVPQNWATKRRQTAIFAGWIEAKIGETGNTKRRRFVLPLDWSARTSYRASVPFDVSIIERSGQYKIWTRLVDANNQNATAWRHTNDLRIGR